MEQPIRVLCVFGGLDRGGSETMCMNLYRNIDRTRVQFDFVKHITKKCDYEDEILALGGKIYTAPSYKIYSHNSYQAWWKRHFEAHPEHQIVHGHFFTISAAYLSVAKKYGRIAIAHSHCTASSSLPRRIVVDIVGYPIRYIADYYFGCSQDAGDYLFGKKVASSDRYLNLKNAIDAKQYIYDKNKAEAARLEFGYSADDIVIGHVGRFTEQKNHMFLLRVFNELHKRDARYKLLLIGKGELEDDVKQKISEYQIEDSVCLAGVRIDVNRLMMGMDLFLFPSKYEGLGIVLIESQAVCCPCIASSAVPAEAKISDIVTFIDLKAPVSEWADKIQAVKLGTRENMYDTVVNAGYDIHDSSRWIQSFYLKINQAKLKQS